MKKRTRVVVLALIAGLFALPALPAAAEDPAPTVSLTSDKAIYAFNQTAQLTSTVTGTNLRLLVLFQYPGSSDWTFLCGTDTVPASYRCSMAMYYNAKLVAQLVDTKGNADASDDELVATSNILSLSTRAALGTVPLSYYTKVRGYFVMNKYAAKFRTQSAPAFPGKRCLRHQVQRKYASGWKLVKTSACILEAKYGRVDWQWGGSHPSRVNYRVRATFAGDAVNRSNNGAWVYFRFR